MSRDIEKDMRTLRDSVNSGLIDDELSRIVKSTRESYTKKGRQELRDEDVAEIAAAASIGGGQPKSLLENLYTSIMDTLNEPDNYNWKAPIFNMDKEKKL